MSYIALTVPAYCCVNSHQSPEQLLCLEYTPCLLLCYIDRLIYCFIETSILANKLKFKWYPATFILAVRLKLVYPNIFNDDHNELIQKLKSTPYWFLMQLESLSHSSVHFNKILYKTPLYTYVQQLAISIPQFSSEHTTHSMLYYNISLTEYGCCVGWMFQAGSRMCYCVG